MVVICIRSNVGLFRENMINRLPCIFLFVIGIAVLSSCENTISEIKAITDPKLVPVQSTYNAVFDYSLHGVLRTRIFAKQMDQYVSDSSYLVAPEPYTILFYDSLGAYVGKMQANEAVFSQKSSKLWAKGNISLENYKNEKLETEHLEFWLDKDSLLTNDHVKITTTNSSIEGSGLRSNGNFTNYELSQTSGDLNTKQP